MPPRLPLTLCQRVAQRHAHTLAFACPVQQRLARVRQSLQQQPSQLQRRESSILAQLSDTAGAYHKRIRRGRGPASGKGKTSGRGHKGQKQHGKVPRNFNGGQTPDIKVSGPRGKKNIYALKFSKINLDNLQSWIDQGRIDPTRPITMRELHHSRLTHGIKDGVKLLARTPIHITVSQASAGAIAAIESAGGTITARYYTRASIKRVLKGESHPTLSLLSASPPVVTEDMLEKAAAAVIGPKAVTVLNMPKQNPHDVVASAGGPSPALLSAIRAYRYRLPDPSRRTDLEYYRDPAKRGYLSYQLAEGQSPSLFYKSPTELLELKRARDERKRVLAEGGADGGKDNEDKMRLF